MSNGVTYSTVSKVNKHLIVWGPKTRFNPELIPFLFFFRNYFNPPIKQPTKSTVTLALCSDWACLACRRAFEKALLSSNLGKVSQHCSLEPYE